MPVVELHSQLSAGKQQGLIDLAVGKVVCGVDELEPLHQPGQACVHSLLGKSAPCEIMKSLQQLNSPALIVPTDTHPSAVSERSEDDCVLRRLISPQPSLGNEFQGLGEVSLGLKQAGVIQFYNSLHLACNFQFVSCREKTYPRWNIVATNDHVFLHHPRDLCAEREHSESRSLE
jgi:hypothetical protein